MAYFRIYCLPEELFSWLDDLRREKDLAALVFSRNERESRLIGAEQALAFRPDLYRLYLMPSDRMPDVPLAMNDVQQRPWGWLVADPGRLVGAGDERCLEQSTIAAEDAYEQPAPGAEPIKPAKYVRWLKRKAKTVATAGVAGVNPGGHSYRDIWYTQRARELFEDGVVWKQNATYRVGFRPIDGDDG
ncbi:MAG: hypothetical protein QNJ94_23745 [Alphaproteobacteria bacterium]|nr:hypothetical protein [Alphaproteobacteria bacterium]